MVNILQKDSPTLRQKAKNLPAPLFGTKELSRIVADMKTALHAEFDGVGLAAPQIGVSYRIFIVAGRVLDSGDSLSETPALEIEPDWSRDLIFINPVLVKTSKDKKLQEEGCLSVRPLYGTVRRASRAAVRAQNEKGVSFERGASGLLAQVFQHELDHLEGVLFIDKASNIREIPLEETPETNLN